MIAILLALGFAAAPPDPAIDKTVEQIRKRDRATAALLREDAEGVRPLSAHTISVRAMVPGVGPQVRTVELGMERSGGGETRETARLARASSQVTIAASAELRELWIWDKGGALTFAFFSEKGVNGCTELRAYFESGKVARLVSSRGCADAGDEPTAVTFDHGRGAPPELVRFADGAKAMAARLAILARDVEALRL